MADYEDLVPSKLERLRLFAPVILRIALGLVFLWFGTNQIMNSSGWTSFLPDFILQIPIPPVFIIFLNGIFEVVLGIFLIIGVFIRASAFLLGAHLLGITLSLGISSVGVRDFGLSFAVLAVAAFGNDIFSLDGFLEKHKTLKKSLLASIFYYVMLLVIAGSTSVYAFNVFHKSDSYKEINLPTKEAPINSEDILTGKSNPSTTPTNTTTKPAINSGLTLTKEVVAKHSTSKDCWIIIEAKVYNVTQYIPFHPGGEKQIISRCGTDASNAFSTKGGLGESHSSNAKKLLGQYYIGAVGQKLASNTLVIPSTSASKPNIPNTSNSSPAPNTVPVNTNTVNTPSTIIPPVSAPQNSPASSGITASSVAGHNSSQDCWIIVSGKVYNVTQYIPFHPGGQAQIISRCGTDATTAFNTKGGSGGTHSTNAHNLLANYYIGDVGLASSPTPTTTPTTSTQATLTDTTAPVVSISTPTQGSMLSGTATISVSATDSNGVLNVKFMIDGTVFQTISSAPFSAALITTNYGNGSHTINVSAVDLAGNTGSASVNISINNQVTQTGPATYTAVDVATHSSQSNCWIIVSGKVYNVTQYIPFHPGGANRIINVCGTDATTAFNTRGGSGSHSQNAHNLLAGYYLGDVGAVSNGGTATPSSSATSTPIGTNGTYTVTVSSNGALSPGSLTISVQDTVRFSYANPGDEVVLTFSPKPPSDIKLDHDSTLKSYKFTQAGTYTYHKKDGSGPTGTIIVQ